MMMKSKHDPKVAAEMMRLLDRQGFMGLDYVSEDEIRQRAEESFKRVRDRKLDKLSPEERALVEETSMRGVLTRESREAWTQKLLDIARKRGCLMTSQQYADYRLSVRLQKGTLCRYVGPSREETSENGQVVLRPHGQRGVIVDVVEEKKSRILVFHPHEAVKPTIPENAEAVFVDLQVREYTPGWLHIEREVLG